MNAEVDVGARVRLFRKKRGMTLMELSRLTGIAPSNLSSIELNKSSPTLATLLRIADAFDMRVGPFLEEALYDTAAFLSPESGRVTEIPPGRALRTLTSDLALAVLDCRVLTMEPGSPPLSLGVSETDRFIYCIRGQAAAAAGVDSSTLVPGAGLYVFPSVDVAVTCRGDESAELLLITGCRRAKG